MKISEQGVAITERFFLAIDTLKRDKVIHSLLEFTTTHNINRWNLITVRNQPQQSVLKPEWIFYLCNSYNVSADWIILGKGSFYANDKLSDKLDI